MKEIKKLSDYLALEYEMRVGRKDGFFVVGIPELGIVKKSLKCEEAIAEANTAREALLKSFFENGYAAWIPAPVEGGSPPLKIRNGSGSLWEAIRRAIIPIVIIAVTVILLACLMRPIISRMGLKVTKIETKFKKIETKFKSLEDLSDEKVELYRMRARKICGRIKPITDEIKVLWEEKK